MLLHPGTGDGIDDGILPLESREDAIVWVVIGDFDDIEIRVVDQGRDALGGFTDEDGNGESGFEEETFEQDGA